MELVVPLLLDFSVLKGKKCSIMRQGIRKRDKTTKKASYVLRQAMESKKYIKTPSGLSVLQRGTEQNHFPQG